MKHLYEHNNMKTKGTITHLRGIQNQLIMERNWEDDKDFIMKEMKKKDVEIMTDEQHEVVFTKMLDKEIDCNIIVHTHGSSSLLKDSPDNYQSRQSLKQSRSRNINEKSMSLNKSLNQIGQTINDDGEFFNQNDDHNEVRSQS